MKLAHVGVPAAAAASITLAVAGCGTGSPWYFLASNDSAVVLISWGPVSNSSVPWARSPTTT